MGGRQYFFPPNADPIHHEIAGEAVDWINRIGEANKAGFGYNGACNDTVTTECYFNYDTYDLFFMGYGDTVPTAGFGAAGMTYEKGSASAVQDRVQQQFHTQWSTLGWAAANKREVLDRLLRHLDRRARPGQGRHAGAERGGAARPTRCSSRCRTSRSARTSCCPTGSSPTSASSSSGCAGWTSRSTRSRSRPGCRTAQVFGGRSATNLTVPKGAYWIPMDQPQKHWIQAIMGEDPYVPFPYFYDVSSWSNPLLMGINTIYTGDDRARPRRERVRPIRRRHGAAARPGGSYTYPLDSAAAAEFTFTLLGAGVTAGPRPGDQRGHAPGGRV